MSADASRLALCRKALEAIEAIRERMEGLDEALDALNLRGDWSHVVDTPGRMVDCARADFSRIEREVRQELADVERRAVVATAAREG